MTDRRPGAGAQVGAKQDQRQQSAGPDADADEVEHLQVDCVDVLQRSRRMPGERHRPEPGERQQCGHAEEGDTRGQRTGGGHGGGKHGPPQEVLTELVAGGEERRLLPEPGCVEPAP